MKILLNASTVKIGGGLTEVINLLTAIKELSNTDVKFILVAPRGVGYEVFTDVFDVVWVPENFLKRYRRLTLDGKWMRQIVFNEKIDIVFTLGNIPVKVDVKQVVFFDNPLTTAENLKQLGLGFYEKIIHGLRNHLFYQRMKYVNLIFAQTKLQKQKLEQNIRDIPIKILENSPTIFNREYISTDFKIDNTKIRLLCFTRYYPHKNIETLLNVADIILKEKKNYQIIFTIEKDQHPHAKRIIEDIDNGTYKDTIINIGKIERNEIFGLYNQVDALLLPTMLESFSTTYADSMSLGIPILTSDLDFAREVCGDAAFYFQPKDERDIFNTIEQAFSNRLLLRQKIEKGKEKVKQFRTWNQIAMDTIEILTQL